VNVWDFGDLVYATLAEPFLRGASWDCAPTCCKKGSKREDFIYPTVNLFGFIFLDQFL